MGRIRETWSAFWDSRRARYQAVALKEQANAHLHERRLRLARKPDKSVSEIMEQALLESTETAFGWDRVNVFKDQLDYLTDFSRGGIGVGSGGMTDHTNKRGANFPFFNSETELGLRRDTSRVIVGTNDNAIGLLGGLRRHTLGTGVTARAVPRRESDAELAAQAQAVIDSFARANKMAFRQREHFTRTSRDGEGIIRLFPEQDGTARARFVWSEQIRQPINIDSLKRATSAIEPDAGCPDGCSSEWSYGRLTDSDDIETTLAWSIYPTEGAVLSPEIVGANDILFLGLNADSGVKRSLPDFCLATGDELEAAGKLAQNMGEGSAQQASIAFIREHEKAMPRTAIRAFRDADASYTKTDPYTGNDIAVRKALPGTVVDTTEGTKFLASPYNAGIEGHVSVFQLLIRRACARWNAPEWLGSSYNDAANFATALEEGSPFILTTLETQEYYTDYHRDLYERVLAIAAAAGRLDRDVLSRIEVKVTLPSPQVRNRLQDAQANTLEIQAGYQSPQGATEEAGKDWHKIKKEREAVGLPIAPQAGGTGGAGGANIPKPGTAAPTPGEGGVRPPTAMSASSRGGT